MNKSRLFCWLGVCGLFLMHCTSTYPLYKQPADTTPQQKTHVNVNDNTPNMPLGLHATIKTHADAVIEAYLSSEFPTSKYEFETLLRVMDPLLLESRADKINHLDKFYPPIDQSLTFAIIDDDLRWRKVQPIAPVQAPPPTLTQEWEKAEVPDDLFETTSAKTEQAGIVAPTVKRGSYFDKGLHKFIQKEIREVAIHMGEPENFKLPDDFVKEIEYYIRRFQNESYYQKFFQETLRRSRKYVPALRDIFLEKNLPEEIMYLAFIESGFNPIAYSRSHAAGMFQFIKSTGLQYGLTINRNIDERYSPIKSAQACREYLHDLLLELGSFTMALSSYNSGAGKTRRALRQLEDYRDRSFWALREKTNVLKHETREYVPQIFAVIVMAKPGNPSQFGFEDVPFPQNYDMVVVPSPIDLSSVATAAGIDMNALRYLNPDLPSTATHTPKRVIDYPLFVPRGTKNAVEHAVQRLTSRRSAVASNRTDSNTSSGAQAYHRVQKGESLWLIARKYGVSVNQLKQWNGLQGNNLYAGAKLVIYPKNAVKTSSASTKTEQAAASLPTNASNGMPKNVLVQQNIASGESFDYAVTSGNNLSMIAEMFGVGLSQLKQWNRSATNILRVGQRLKIIAPRNIQYSQYRVQSGDTISDVAANFGASEGMIRFANGKSNNVLRVGEVLKIFSW